MVQLDPEIWQASPAHRPGYIPSRIIHNQSVVHLEGQTSPLPSIAAFANGLANLALHVHISVEAGSSFPLSVYFVPGSSQRGAFFLTV